MIIMWMIYCYKNFEKKKRKETFWVSMRQIHVVNLSNPRGRSCLGRDLCRGLNAGDRREKRRKRKSCAGGRGNKSVRPPRLTVRVSFLLSFNFFRGQLQHWSKNEPNSTFHLSADALWRNTECLRLLSRRHEDDRSAWTRVTYARTFVYWNFHRITIDVCIFSLE